MSDLKTEFEAKGFLVLNDFYSSGHCDTLNRRAAELSRQFELNQPVSVFQTSEQSKTTDDYFLESGNNISFFFEKDAFDTEGKLKQSVDKSFNKIGHALHDRDDLFNSFSRSERMKELSAELGASDHVVMQSMYIFKHAKIGGVVDVHQDSTFLYTEPDSCIGFWFALEDATVDNGCLWAKPGGHLTTFRSRFKRKLEGGTEMEILDPTPYSLDGMIPLEVKKGTCIVLHGYLPHYSLPNISGKSRPAYAIHTVNPNCHYPNDNWLQRDPGFALKGF